MVLLCEELRLLARWMGLRSAAPRRLQRRPTYLGDMSSVSHNLQPHPLEYLPTGARREAPHHAGYIPCGHHRNCKASCRARERMRRFLPTVMRLPSDSSIWTWSCAEITAEPWEECLHLDVRRHARRAFLSGTAASGTYQLSMRDRCEPARRPYPPRTRSAVARPSEREPRAIFKFKLRRDGFGRRVQRAVPPLLLRLERARRGVFLGHPFERRRISSSRPNARPHFPLGRVRVRFSPPALELNRINELTRTPERAEFFDETTRRQAAPDLFTQRTNDEGWGSLVKHAGSFFARCLRNDRVRRRKHVLGTGLTESILI